MWSRRWLVMAAMVPPSTLNKEEERFNFCLSIVTLYLCNFLGTMVPNWRRTQYSGRTRPLQQSQVSSPGWEACTKVLNVITNQVSIHHFNMTLKNNFQVPSYGLLSLIKLVLFAAYDRAKDPEQTGVKGLHYEQSTQYWLIWPRSG